MFVSFCLGFVVNRVKGVLESCVQCLSFNTIFCIYIGTANPGVAGSKPGPATYFRGDLSRNNFYGHPPLALIQEGQLLVSGESMCAKYWLTD